MTKRRIQAELAATRLLDNSLQPAQDVGASVHPIHGNHDSAVTKDEHDFEHETGGSKGTLVKMLVIAGLVISAAIAGIYIDDPFNTVDEEVVLSINSGSISNSATLEMDHLFLMGRVAALEKSVITQMENSSEGQELSMTLTETKETLDRIIATLGETLVRLDQHNQKIIDLENSVERAADLEARLAILERSAKAPLATPPQPARVQAEPISQGQAVSMTSAAATSNALKTAPWVIMALSEKSVFVRNTESGEQKLLRKGSSTTACGDVLGIDVAKQELLTSTCAPLGR